MSVRFICDWCDRPLPVTITGEGTENKKITAELYFPKEINVRKFFPHLCESCARKIDIIVGFSRESGYKKADIVARYRRINEERRRKLGTKG